MSNEPARQLSRVAVIVVVVVVQECHPNQSERRPFDCLSALPQINGDHHLMAIARLVLGLPPLGKYFNFFVAQQSLSVAGGLPVSDFDSDFQQLWMKRKWVRLLKALKL